MSLGRACRLGSSVLIGALMLASAGAAAELSVRGPEGCPDAAEIAFRVERATGVPLGESGALRFGVVFAARPGSDPGYSVRLQVQHAGATEPSTERVIRAQACGPLGDAVSVAIALAIGAEQLSSAPPEVSELGAVLARDAEVAPSSPEERASSWLLVAQAFLLADGGSLASPGLGVGIGTELRGARLALRAQGAWLLEQRVGLQARDDAPGAALSLMLGSLSGCVAPLARFRSPFAPFACAGWELGRLEGAGVGITEPRTVHQLWTAPRADVGFTGAVPGSPLRLALQLSVAAPLERDDFCLRELGCVYRPPGAVGRLSVGIELGFE